MKYCFFLDIDGTIVDRGKIPTEAFLRVIDKARSQGHRFFINTARTRTNVSPETFHLDKLDGLCAGCGMTVIYRGETVFEAHLPPETAFETVEAIQACQPNAIFALETVDGLFYSDEVLQEERPDRIGFKNADELRKSYPNIKLQKLATYHGDKFSKETAENVASIYTAYFHAHYTELVPHGYDKGRAVKVVEQVLGVPHESTVAIGDSHNDVPMMEYCAYSVAMDNAPDDVKAICDTVTESVENDGAAKAIARLCGIDYGKIEAELNS